MKPKSLLTRGTQRANFIIGVGSERRFYVKSVFCTIYRLIFKR